MHWLLGSRKAMADSPTVTAREAQLKRMLEVIKLTE
jgi:hypothetical protein